MEGHRCAVDLITLYMSVSTPIVVIHEFTAARPRGSTRVREADRDDPSGVSLVFYTTVCPRLQEHQPFRNLNEDHIIFLEADPGADSQERLLR